MFSGGIEDVFIVNFEHSFIYYVAFANLEQQCTQLTSTYLMTAIKPLKQFVKFA